MDIKGAIEFIETEKRVECGYATQCALAKDFDKVIELLKRGEKYGQILKLIEEEKIQPRVDDSGNIIFILRTKNKGNKNIFSLRAVFRHLLCHTSKELEQDCFPKPSGNFTEKVMDKINNEGEK